MFTNHGLTLARVLTVYQSLCAEYAAYCVWKPALAGTEESGNTYGFVTTSNAFHVPVLFNTNTCIGTAFCIALKNSHIAVGKSMHQANGMLLGNSRVLFKNTCICNLKDFYTGILIVSLQTYTEHNIYIGLI